MATGHGHSENILKQGYLKKSVQTSDVIPSASKQIAKNIKQRLEPNRWYVFGVRNRVPYLEYFDKEESVFTGPPLDSYNLSSFQSLSYTMGRTNSNFTFCIFLADRTIELTAPSRAHMVEWCRCLERNLRNLGLRSKHLRDDHQYTAFPVKGDYKPTKTSIDDPPEEPTLEERLVELADDKLDDEAEVHDYQDAMLLKLDNDTDQNKQPTLPLRPPPRIPKRDRHEEVFASLSTVRREDVYSNFKGHNQDVTEKEAHLFDTSSDSESDKESTVDNDETAVKRISAEEKTSGTEMDDSEDRCTSLPDIPTVPQESDTSEDSDFVSASFWLRNRRPGHFPQQDGDTPPEVPVRFDSVGPKPVTRRCVSMDLDYLKPAGSPLHWSPSLEQLGEAPAIPKRNGNDDDNDGTLKFVERTANNYPNQKEEVEILKNDNWFAVNNGLESKVIVKSTSKMSKSDDEGGVYELLSEKSSPSRTAGVKNAVNGLVQDDVYEATWECSSARRSYSDDDDDVCCSGGKESEKHVVAIPGDKKVNVNNCNGYVEMRNHESGEHSQKHKSVLSKIFQRKPKDKELPECLVVSLPTENSLNSGSGSDGPVDQSAEGNFYSDFPSPTEHQNSNPLDSDILKLSILENGPTSSEVTSPIELPKRDFSQYAVKSATIHEITRQKQNISGSAREPLQCFNQNAYEPMELSKSAQQDYQSNRPRAPSPPAKSKLSKKSDIDFFAMEEAPVAPPRRNRKTEKSMLVTDSFEAERVNKCVGSPPIPKKRQSVLAALSVSSRESVKEPSREPALPPRIHHDDGKPEVPVPPPPRRVSRATTDVNGGARPKTIHLASRQQSVNQSAAGLTVMNLKQNQVDILKSEIESTGGLVKCISKVHFQSGLALVECFNKIWIAGWDVKKFPRLYDKFHIGDQLVSINDVQVTDLSFAHKLVKNVKAENMEITIKRLPNAKVLAIQRSAEGESLGIKREGGTAEIVYVDPLGLAYKHGLNNKTVAMDGNSISNWMLTEINMRPLNLFFKDTEIERRLSAVGRDISIVVQPSDFVKELKKQMKKVKSYKDFLIQ